MRFQQNQDHTFADRFHQKLLLLQDQGDESHENELIS